jgi:hypothetical protein
MDLNLTLIVTLDKGVTVFTNKEYREEELVGRYLENTPNKLGRKVSDELWESDILGRFCNHSEHPNTSLIKTETGYDLYANKSIEIGDEITVSYYAVEFKLNIPRGTYISPSFVNRDYKKFGKVICEY